MSFQRLQWNRCAFEVFVFVLGRTVFNETYTARQQQLPVLLTRGLRSTTVQPIKNQQAALCESIMGHVELLDRCLALPFWCVSPPLDSRKAAQLEIMIPFQDEAKRGT